MTPEVHLVQEFDELPNVYGVELQDRPNPSTIAVYFKDTGWMTGDGFTGLTQLTQVTASNPSAGQFRIGGGNSGKLILNIADDGKEVIVSYQGGGTTTAFQNIYNLIVDIIGTITDTFDRVFTNFIRARTTSGIGFETSAGSTIATFGAASSINTSLQGALNVEGAAVVKGVAAVGDGTVSNPGLHFEQDTNTGLYRIGADQAGFAVNECEFARCCTWYRKKYREIFASA
jgi:hypothetical protein